MNKSDLIELIAQKQTSLPKIDVELAINQIVTELSITLAAQSRIEIRGFGSFGLIKREARTYRNPRTGAAVDLQDRHYVHFKAGRSLKTYLETCAGKSDITG